MNKIGGVYPEDLYEVADGVWELWNSLNYAEGGKLDETSLILMITRSLMNERERCAKIAESGSVVELTKSSAKTDSKLSFAIGAMAQRDAIVKAIRG